MTLRHLNIFLTVCKENNMTKAAQKLYITQPSVTQAIKELEIYYNVQLFERNGKKIAISKDGYKLLPIAKNIVNLFDESKKIMIDDLSYECIIGASVTVGTYILPNLLKNINRINNLNTKYIIDNTNRIEEGLLNSTIDIAIIEGEVQSKYLISKSFMKDNLGIVCSSKSNFLLNKSNSLYSLNNCNFIFREEGSGTKKLIEEIFIQNNIQINNIGTVNNIEAIKNMVINNLGISILPKISIIKEIEEGTIKYIEFDDIKMNRTFKIVYHKEKILNIFLNNIIETISNYK